MALDVGQVAATTVAIVAPFTPFLIEVGKVGAETLAEVIAEKGGEAAWKQAQELWGKIKARFSQDDDVQMKATWVALEPEDEARQSKLAAALAERLEQDPVLAQELLDLLGGEETVQHVLATRGSLIRSVQQIASGAGKTDQRIFADEQSTVEDVYQQSGP